MEESLKLAQDANERVQEARSSIYLGKILGRANKLQYGEAEEHIVQGLRISDELKLKPILAGAYLHLGELYGDMGQAKKALETLKKAEGMFQEMGIDYWLRRTQEVLDKVQG